MRTNQTFNEANTTTAPRPEQISTADENENVNPIDISSSDADSSKPSNSSGRCSDCFNMTEAKLRTIIYKL